VVWIVRDYFELPREPKIVTNHVILEKPIRETQRDVYPVIIRRRVPHKVHFKPIVPHGFNEVLLPCALSRPTSAPRSLFGESVVTRGGFVFGKK
jgi:hypothetical protein